MLKINRSVFSILQPRSTLKGILLLCSVISISACTSFKSQSEKLSTGIQKAYSVQASTANRLSPLILQSSEKHNVPATLIAAVIHQESSYRPNVSSHAGAVGLMQIIPKYWQKTCPGNLYHESININCGSLILAKYYKQAGNWDKALGYYNVGPSGYENNRTSRNSAKKYSKSVKTHEKSLKKAM